MSESNLVFWRTVSSEEAAQLVSLHDNQEQRPSESHPGCRDIYIPKLDGAFYFLRAIFFKLILICDIFFIDIN